MPQGLRTGVITRKMSERKPYGANNSTQSCIRTLASLPGIDSVTLRHENGVLFGVLGVKFAIKLSNVQDTISADAAQPNPIEEVL